MRLRIEEQLHVTDVEAELPDARDDHRRGARVATVDQDMTLWPGDQERRDIIGADVVEVAGDPEWLGVELAAALRRIPPLAEEDDGDDSDDSEQDPQPSSPGRAELHVHVFGSGGLESRLAARESFSKYFAL